MATFKHMDLKENHVSALKIISPDTRVLNAHLTVYSGGYNQQYAILMLSTYMYSIYYGAFEATKWTTPQTVTSSSTVWRLTQAPLSLRFSLRSQTSLLIHILSVTWKIIKLKDID